MVTNRNIALCIVFTVITCGIYGLYWLVVLTDDLNTLSGEADTTGGIALLLTIVTCGIYGLFWAYRCGEKIDQIHRQRGQYAGNSGVLYLILYIFFAIIAYALIQNEINQLSYKQY